VSGLRFGSLGLIIIGTQLNGNSAYLGPAIVFSLIDLIVVLYLAVEIGRHTGHATGLPPAQPQPPLAPETEQKQPDGAEPATQQAPHPPDGKGRAYPVERGSLHGTEQVERALRVCAEAGRFAAGDSPSILAHQQASGELVRFPRGH
jgi:hypothetical protein